VVVWRVVVWRVVVVVWRVVVWRVVVWRVMIASWFSNATLSAYGLLAVSVFIMRSL
jgi:hypothetical protein